MDEAPSKSFDVNNRRLCETIENVNDSCTTEELVAILKRNKEKIQKLLDIYRKPSTASRTAVKTGSVASLDSKEKPITLDNEAQKFVLLLSDALLLDEVQAAQLFHQFVALEIKGQPYIYDLNTVDRVFTYYFDERSSILRIIASLFQNMGDDTHFFHEAITAFMAPFERDVAKSLYKLFSSLYSFEVPPMDQRWQTRWALQNLREQALVLEALFYAHYDNTKYSGKEVLEALKLFKECGSHQRNLTYIAGQADDLVNRVSYLCVLLIIEMLNLEDWDARALAGINDGNWPFVEDILSKGDLTIFYSEVKANWMSLRPHGPVLLAFAALFSDADAISEPQFDCDSLARDAIDSLSAFEYLARLVKDCDEIAVINAVGYKSVLKGYLTSVLGVLDVGALTKRQFGCVVDIFTTIFTDQPLLVDQFWEYDSLNPDSPLRRVLLHSVSLFPSDFTSLVRILGSLAYDDNTSLQSFRSFGILTTLTEVIRRTPETIGCYEFVSGNAVRATKPINLNIVRIPSGATGEALQRSSDEGVRYEDQIRWSVTYSGWHLSFAMLDRFIKSSGNTVLALPLISHVQAFAQFLHRLVANGLSPFDLEKHLTKDKVGIVQFSLPQASLAMVFKELFEIVAYANTPVLPLLEATLGCIRCLVEYDPREAATVARSLRPQALRHVLDGWECASGNYAVTIAALRLVRAMKFTAHVWRLEGAKTNRPIVVDLTDHIEFVTSYVWPSYETWKYVVPGQRFEIGLLVLDIFDEILTDNFSAEPPKSFGVVVIPFKQRLQTALLYDSTFHVNLLKIVAIGPHALELRLSDARGDGQTLESLIEVSVGILKKLLIARLHSVAGPVSSLENALLTRRADGSDLVRVIASFIDYYPSATLAKQAVDVLALLCKLSATYPRPISLLGYLEANKSDLRVSYLNRLTGRREGLPLRTAIIELIDAAVDAQPGLATLFFSPSVLRPPLMQPDTKRGATAEEVTAFHENQAKQKAEDDRLVDFLITSLTLEGALNFQRRPSFLAHIVALLNKLWMDAPANAAVIGTIRSNPDFWPALVRLAQLDPNKKFPDERGGDYAEIRCNRLWVCASIFDLFMLEIFFVPQQARLDETLTAAIKSALVADQGSRMQRWITHYAQAAYSDEFDAKFHALCSLFGLEASQLKSDEPQHSYGRGYLYDPLLLRRKLALHGDTDVSDEDTGLSPNDVAKIPENDRKARVFIAMVEAQNLQLSLIDAQLLAMQRFRRFAEIVLLRQPQLALFDKIEGRAAAALALSKKLSTQQVTLKLMDRESAEFLLVVVREWTKTDFAKEPEKSYLDFLESLNAALDVSMNAMDVDERVALPLVTSLLLIVQGAPLVDKKQFWSGPLSARVIPFMPTLLMALRLLPSVRLPVISILTAMVQRVKSVKDIEHALVDDVHNPMRMFISMLSAELDVMPLIDPAKEKSKAKGAGDSRSVPSTPSAQKKEQQQTAEEKEKEREKEKEKEGEAAVAKTVTLLFTAFCRSPIFAESMINEGLMMLLRHDRLVNAKLLPYTMAGARNPWHVLWTQLVRLIAMLLIPLGSTTHFIEQIIDLLRVYRMRIVSALTLPLHRPRELPPPSTVLAKSDSDSARGIDVLSIGGMEEVEATIALLYRLAQFERQWSFAERDIANDHIKLMVNLFEWTLALFTDPNKLIGFVRPISKDEKKLIKTDEANVSNGALQLLKSDFYQRVQLQIQQMLNSSMAYLRLMLPVPADEPLQQRKHVRAFTPFFDALLAIREPAIAPSAAAVLNMYSPPPLRVFVKYLNYLDGTLFQASTSDEVLKVALTGLDSALYIILTHANFFLSPSLSAYHASLFAIVTELLQNLSSIKTFFEKTKQSEVPSDLLTLACDYLSALKNRHQKKGHLAH